MAWTVPAWHPFCPQVCISAISRQGQAHARVLHSSVRVQQGIMLAGSLASSRSPDVRLSALSRYERRRDECCTHMSSTRTGRCGFCVHGSVCSVGLPALQYTSLCVLWDCVLPTGWACACCKPEVSDFLHDWLGCGAQPRSMLWSGLHVVCAVVSSSSALPLPIWAGLHCVWLQRGTSLHKRPLGLQSRKVCKRLRDTSMSAVSATVCLAGVCVGLHSL